MPVISHAGAGAISGPELQSNTSRLNLRRNEMRCVYYEEGEIWDSYGGDVHSCIHWWEIVADFSLPDYSHGNICLSEHAGTNDSLLCLMLLHLDLRWRLLLKRIKNYKFQCAAVEFCFSIAVGSSGMLIWNCKRTTKYVTIVARSCRKITPLINQFHHKSSPIKNIPTWTMSYWRRKIRPN